MNERFKKILVPVLCMSMAFSSVYVYAVDDENVTEVTEEKAEEIDDVTDSTGDKDTYEESFETHTEDSNIIEEKMETKEDMQEVAETAEVIEESSSIEEVESVGIVNDVIGMNESDIEENIGVPEENIIIKYVIEDGIEEGTIIEQSVEPGEELGADEKVIVDIATEPIDLEQEDDFQLLNHFALVADAAPSIEDNTWNDDYGYFYDYNYDTSSAAQWGAWGGNGNLQGQTYEDTNNNDINNKFGLYTDGKDVKLYISYASMFQGTGNGDDYNFKIDGEGTKFQVLLEDGTNLRDANLTPGTYNLIVINENMSPSGTQVLGAYGSIIIKENNCNNEMEIVIPVDAMKAQNGNINTDSFSTVSFFTPNLMRSDIYCGGASSGSNYFIIITFAFFIPFVMYLKKKGKFEFAQVLFA